MVSLMPAVRERVAEQIECDPDDVSIDDRYNDGDCIEVIMVDGLGDVGTLDRKAPEWFKPISAR